MTIVTDVEDESWSAIPDLEKLTRNAVMAAFAATGTEESKLETDILFTGDKEISALNLEWRGKDQATNVLSFPADDMPLPDGVARPLGDIVLAAGVIAREALEQGKTLPDHTTHLIIHGVLHLLGYDHENDGEAQEMERLETDILKGLGISDPYERK
jgi:probable rRNA maturation factor